MARVFMCSSHTISGVMPGGPEVSRHALEARLAACAAAGYEGFWLHWRDYREQLANGVSAGLLRALFDRHGMAHRGVEFLTDWFVDGDGAAREAEALAFDAATAIGAGVVNVGADFLGRGFSRRHMIERFAGLCARAADRGLSIALEFAPWSDAPDVAAALDFMAPANAGLAIDAWHVFRGETSLAQIRSLPPEKILCAQINDATEHAVGPLAEDTRRRLFCGEGAFDLTGFAAALDAAGAAAPFSVEIISPAVAAMPLEEAARRSYATARAAFTI